MKKVFVLLQKSFFISNCIDYACAVGSENISIFSKLEDAQKEMNKLCDEIKKEMIRNKVFDSEICDSMYCVLYRNDKSRRVFEICEKFIH